MKGGKGGRKWKRREVILILSLHKYVKEKEEKKAKGDKRCEWACVGVVVMVWTAKFKIEMVAGLKWMKENRRSI